MIRSQAAEAPAPAAVASRLRSIAEEGLGNARLSEADAMVRPEEAVISSGFNTPVLAQAVRPVSFHAS